MATLMMGTFLGVLTVPAHANNILGNPGFENSNTSLLPWFQGYNGCTSQIGLLHVRPSWSNSRMKG
jgi:hypothetical protein